MPRFAVTIGSYALPNFVALNIAALRRLFGADLPILVSDDRSHLSPRIEQIAKMNRCAFYCSKVRRHHFAADMQAVLNSISFAKQVGAKWAVKASQRLILFSHKLRPILDHYLADPKIIIALPGSPDPTRSRSPGFAKYPFLTDVMFLRASEIDPTWLREYYEGRWKNGHAKVYDSFIELTVDSLIKGEWASRACVVHELTNMPQDSTRYFLRRYQNSAAEYERLAAELGVNARGFQLDEWRKLDPHYSPAPKA